VAVTEQCSRVSLDGRRCWRTAHEDWCCGFERPLVILAEQEPPEVTRDAGGDS
jgi:hypothetical protein